MLALVADDLTGAGDAAVGFAEAGWRAVLCLDPARPRASALAVLGDRIVAVGDDKQCQGIEAGPVVNLMRRALGPEAVPEILTTRRQRTEREREIAGLFRDGKAAEALAMGLAVRVVALSELDSAVATLVAALLAVGRDAAAAEGSADRLPCPEHGGAGRGACAARAR